MPRSRSILVVVFLTVFIDLVGFGIVIPLLPLYAEKYHPSPLAFGLLMSSYSAMQFLWAPVLGRLSDRFGRRPVLLASLAGTVIGYLLFAFSRSLAMLFASRLLDGATGGNISTAQAVIADTTSREERAKGMGLVGMAFGLGFILGPAIAGFTVTLGESAPGLAAAALSLTALVWTYLRLPETRPKNAAPRPIRFLPFAALVHGFRRKETGPLLFLSLVMTAAFSNFEATFAQFLSAHFGAGPSTVAWFFVAVGVSIALVQGVLVRRLVGFFGEARLVVAGMAILVLGFLSWLVVGAVPGVLGAIALMALGTGLATPTLAALISRRSGSEEQGEVLGAFQSMSALGRVAGPFWGENVYLRFGPHSPHVTGAVLDALALALSAPSLLSENRRRAAADATAARKAP
jgi:DHA1 family tetracycline resistance protein-like MFS transporter